MRRLPALAVAGLLLVGCGRVDEDSAPSSTPPPVAPTEPPAEVTTAATAAPRPPSPARRATSTTPTTARQTPTTARPAPTAPRATTTTARATTTSSSTTTSTTVPLPVPIDPPAEDGTRDPEMVLGRIEIPAIELDSELQEGIRIATLDDGPGHWPGTAMPGELGNTVVAGHRTSAGAEFRRIDELVEGDEVVMTTPHGRFVYLVESVEIVAPDALWVVDQTREYTATLFACHPPGSVAQRIVAHLRLADA